MWNLRIELAQLAQPTQLRTTQLAQAVETSATWVAAPALPEVPLAQITAPQQAGQWARAARPGLFAGLDFVPQEDGTLRCPAGQTLWERERRPQADGSLRIYYAARLCSCRVCALRAQCLRCAPTQTLGRKVSVVLGHPPAPTNPPPLLCSPPPLGTGPLLWRDWGRRQGRRAWMGELRPQQVRIRLVPAPPQQEARASPTLSRAARAHRRLWWAERLGRNASGPHSPRVRIQVSGIPVALAQALGLAS